MRLRDLARNTSLVVAGSLATAVLGLLLRTALARRFGPSDETDAVILAIQTVDGFAVPLAGIVAAVAIPELARLTTDQEADAVARRLLRAMVLLFGATSAALCASATLIARWVVGRDDPDAVALTGQVIAWLSASVVLFGSTGILVAFAQRYRDYLGPASVLPLRNLGALAGVTLVGGRAAVWAAVAGYLTGSVAQVAVLMARVGRRLRAVPPVPWRHPSVMAVRDACAPLLVGAVVIQINLFVTLRYAAMLGSGRATEFNYGSAVAALAAAVVGPALADASFPTVSAASASGDRAEVRRQITLVLQGALVLASAMSGLLVALAPDFIAVLFGGSRFPSDSVARSAAVLRVYGLGMVPLVLQTVLARFLYAERAPTRAQVLVGAALLVNLACQPWLMPTFGLPGVAASFVIALTASAIALLVSLARRFHAVDLRALGRSAGWGVATGLGVGAAAAAGASLVDPAASALRAGLGSLAGALALAAALWWSNELQLRDRVRLKWTARS